MTTETTLTTQDERPVQDEQDDVQGYALPALYLAMFIAGGGIGMAGSIGYGDVLWGPSMLVSQYLD